MKRILKIYALILFSFLFNSLQSSVSIDADNKQLDADNKTLNEKYHQERLEAEKETWKQALRSSGLKKKEVEEQYKYLCRSEQEQKQNIKKENTRQPFVDQSLPSSIVEPIQQAARKCGISVDIEAFPSFLYKAQPNTLMSSTHKSLFQKGGSPMICINPDFFNHFSENSENFYQVIMHELTHLVLGHPHTYYYLNKMCPNLNSAENNTVILQQEITADTLPAAKSPAEGHRIYNELNRRYKAGEFNPSDPTHPTPSYSASEIEKKIFTQYTLAQNKALAATRELEQAPVEKLPMLIENQTSSSNWTTKLLFVGFVCVSICFLSKYLNYKQKN